MATRGRASGRSGRPAGHGSRPAGDVTRPPTGGPTSGDLAAYKLRLREVVGPVAGSAGYDLEDLAVVRMGRRYVIRVTVDRDGGVGLDAVAELSRDISNRLDAAESTDGEFIAGEYQLEVSSPGTDRPLRLPRHWRRNVGRLVTVRLDGSLVTGRIVAADDDTATLSVDGDETTRPYAELGRGRVEVEFSRLDDVDDDDLITFGEDGEDDDFDALAAHVADASGHDVRADRPAMHDDDLKSGDVRSRDGRSRDGDQTRAARSSHAERQSARRKEAEQ
ncbi:MAG TPA: ribosome maturation factor RimP [Micromonosporaceae bacterium]|nr:ribosome maturation factor RimP [Micromonosporaceae bacterium]